LEHYPAPGEELGAVVPAWVAATPPPRVANGTETDVVGYVVGEDALGENPRRPGREIRPVPPVIINTDQNSEDVKQLRKQ
jgi:hypothetical protein